MTLASVSLGPHLPLDKFYNSGKLITSKLDLHNILKRQRAHKMIYRSYLPSSSAESEFADPHVPIWS